MPILHLDIQVWLWRNRQTQHKCRCWAAPSQLKKIKIYIFIHLLPLTSTSKTSHVSVSPAAWQASPWVRRSSRGSGWGGSLYLCSVSSVPGLGWFSSAPSLDSCVQGLREEEEPVAACVDRDRTGSPWRLQRQIRSQALPCCCTGAPGCQLVRDLNEDDGREQVLA